MSPHLLAPPIARPYRVAHVRPEPPPLELVNRGRRGASGGRDGVAELGGVETGGRLGVEGGTEDGLMDEAGGD